MYNYNNKFTVKLKKINVEFFILLSLYKFTCIIIFYHYYYYHINQNIFKNCVKFFVFLEQFYTFLIEMIVI